MYRVIIVYELDTQPCRSQPTGFDSKWSPFWKFLSKGTKAACFLFKSSSCRLETRRMELSLPDQAAILLKAAVSKKKLKS